MARLHRPTQGRCGGSRHSESPGQRPSLCCAREILNVSNRRIALELVRDIQNLPDNGHLYAAHVINDLWRETRDADTIVVTDVGQHQMWEAQYYKHDRARSLITSGGLGTMGFALPAAIGAKVARPEAEVWVIVG